jgi:osmoprotectant transport system permease protein
MLPVLGIGFRPAVAALAIRAFLPIFLNTYVGIQNADAAAVDAARGMGATGLQRLAFVELPLAAPVIYAGIQTATVQNVGIATIAAFIGGGGLGDLILQGLQMLDAPVLLAGAVPVALLAVGAELALRSLGRVVVPAGVRAAGG